MKPILLYSANETTFTSNGLGALNEAISAIVTEERNGTYELVLTYPVSGKHFADIGYSCIIKCATIPGGDYQLFRIYAISKEKNGIITINAEHISYQLSYIPVDGFTATSVTEALYKMGTEAMTTCPFTFWTDKETVARYHQEVPENIRARLGGTSGSILDVYGGEYEWDNYTVKLHNHRGQNRNVTLRYGKNITDIKQEENISNVYTSIVGYYKNEETGTVIKTSVIDSTYASSYPFKRTKIVDFSMDYEEEPTVQQLTQKATAYMNNNNFGIPHVNIQVSFVALWQTDEYKDVAPLEQVYLCDTVSVNFEKLGITTSAKVIKTQYNVLLDKYDSIELGESRTNLSQRLAEQENIIQQQVIDNRTALEKAIDHATELITGGLGGHVVLKQNADGQPEEILIMKKDSITAPNNKMWRWNLGGLGYSDNGYEGPYGTAITMDGAIVADFITTGTLDAARVRAGILTDNLGNNYWNLDTGVLHLASGTGIGNSTVATAVDVNAVDGRITSEITRATGAEGSLSSRISQTDGRITAEVTRATNAESGIVSDYTSKITIAEGHITSEVTRATNAEKRIFANYSGAYTPTLQNAPAVNWGTQQLAMAHDGETFYDTSTEKYYKYVVTVVG